MQAPCVRKLYQGNFIGLIGGVVQYLKRIGSAHTVALAIHSQKGILPLLPTDTAFSS